jgi:hypothetical protein
MTNLGVSLFFCNNTQKNRKFGGRKPLWNAYICRLKE